MSAAGLCFALPVVAVLLLLILWCGLRDLERQALRRRAWLAELETHPCFTSSPYPHIRHTASYGETCARCREEMPAFEGYTA